MSAGKPCPAARKATRGWEIAPTAGPWGSVFALSAGRFLHRPLQWQLVPAEELCSGSLKAWWKPSCLCRLWCDLPRHGICQISNKKCLSSWKELNKLVSSLKTAGRHQKWKLCAFPGCQKCRNATAAKWSRWPGGTWLGETGKRRRSRSWSPAFQGVLQQL